LSEHGRRRLSSGAGRGEWEGDEAAIILDSKDSRALRLEGSPLRAAFQVSIAAAVWKFVRVLSGGREDLGIIFKKIGSVPGTRRRGTGSRAGAESAGVLVGLAEG
jgi:hypothetical protein